MDYKYIVSVSNDRVVVIDRSDTLNMTLPRLTMSRRRSGEFVLPVSDRALIPGILSELRDAGLAFAGAPSGWPPSEVFADLRDRGLVSGPFNELVFLSADQVELRQR